MYPAATVNLSYPAFLFSQLLCHLFVNLALPMASNVVGVLGDPFGSCLQSFLILLRNVTEN